MCVQLMVLAEAYCILIADHAYVTIVVQTRMPVSSTETFLGATRLTE